MEMAIGQVKAFSSNNLKFPHKLNSCIVSQPVLSNTEELYQTFDMELERVFSDNNQQISPIRTSPWTLTQMLGTCTIFAEFQDCLSN